MLRRIVSIALAVLTAIALVVAFLDPWHSGFVLLAAAICLAGAVWSSEMTPPVVAWLPIILVLALVDISIAAVQVSHPFGAPTPDWVNTASRYAMWACRAGLAVALVGCAVYVIRIVTSTRVGASGTADAGAGA